MAARATSAYEQTGLGLQSGRFLTFGAERNARGGTWGSAVAPIDSCQLHPDPESKALEKLNSELVPSPEFLRTRYFLPLFGGPVPGTISEYGLLAK